MTYNVLLTRPAFKVYGKLDYKIKSGLDRCIAFLEISPRYGPNIEKIKGKPDCYRYQVGGWRILYKVDEGKKEVRIYGIRPRGDIYKHSH
jgi:mRNA interferase RelE/StbE